MEKQDAYRVSSDALAYLESMTRDVRIVTQSLEHEAVDNLNNQIINGHQMTREIHGNWSVDKMDCVPDFNKHPKQLEELICSLSSRIDRMDEMSRTSGSQRASLNTASLSHAPSKASGSEWKLHHLSSTPTVTMHKSLKRRNHLNASSPPAFEELEHVLDRMNRLDKLPQQAYMGFPGRIHSFRTQSIIRTIPTPNQITPINRDASNTILDVQSSTNRDNSPTAVFIAPQRHDFHQPGIRQRSSSHSFPRDTTFEELDNALDRMGRMGRLTNQMYVPLSSRASNLAASTLCDSTSLYERRASLSLRAGRMTSGISRTSGSVEFGRSSSVATESDTIRSDIGLNASVS